MNLFRRPCDDNYIFSMKMKNDAYVKSPFYMDLGITNYYKIVIAKGITNIPKLSDFLQVCQE